MPSWGAFLLPLYVLLPVLEGRGGRVSTRFDILEEPTLSFPCFSLEGREGRKEWKKKSKFPTTRRA